MKQQQISKILNEWWQDERTCDLCVDCFERLCEKFDYIGKNILIVSKDDN